MPGANNPYGATVPPTQAPPGAPATFGGVNAAPALNVMAIISLVVSCLGCGCCFLSITGIVLGVLAKKQIKESQGAQTGDGLATAG